MLEGTFRGLSLTIMHPFNVISILQIFGFFSVIYALRRVYVIAFVYYNRPTNVPLQATPFAIGKWWQNFDFIFHGPTLILEGYNKYSKSSSFGIPSLEEYQVLACTKADIKELCNSKEDALSFHVAMTDRMFHKYTMYGFEYGEPDPHDNVPTRAIKVLFRMQLPLLRPLIERKVRHGFEQEISHGLTVDGWSSVSTMKFTKGVIEEVNAQIILGEKLASKPNCVEAAIRYSHDAVIAAEIARQFPRFMIPVVAPGVMAWSGAMKKVAGYITAVVEERLAQEMKGLNPSKTYMDCIQWTIDSSQTPGQRATPRLVAQIIGILLASSHQLSMFLAYIIYNICIYPEYLTPLREEIAAAMRISPEDPFKEMHLLDGFLLETARLNPLDALAVQRKVLKPTTLPSGAYIPPGNLIAVPQHAVYQDANRFSNPLHFNPRRFRQQTQDDDKPVKKFTDVSYDYLHWGSPRRACPGRWYATHTLKQAVVHLVTEYDVKLQNEKADRSFFWTTAIVPRFSTRFMLKKRVQMSIKKPFVHQD
ncbi:cytochrome P450 [Bisporella sp. PMI_857]|nr:cytochrome P450 [Bisporella sp. PMI_857]